MAGRLRDAGVLETDELIVVHVSAGNPFRRWPEPFFVDLVAHLAAGGPTRRSVLSSGPSDRDAARRIAAAARQRLGDAAGRIVDLGEFDLQELRALIGRSRLFVGGHGSAAHRGGNVDPDGWNIRPDALGPVGAMASVRSGDDVGRDRGTSVPAMRSAGLCPW